MPAAGPDPWPGGRGLGSGDTMNTFTAKEPETPDLVALARPRPGDDHRGGATPHPPATQARPDGRRLAPASPSPPARHRSAALLPRRVSSGTWSAIWRSANDPGRGPAAGVLLHTFAVADGVGAVARLRSPSREGHREPADYRPGKLSTGHFAPGAFLLNDAPALDEEGSSQGKTKSHNERILKP